MWPLEPGQYEPTVDEIKPARWKFVFKEIVDTHIQIWVIQLFERSRVDVCGYNEPASPDSFAKPCRNRAPASTDLQAMPAGLYAPRLEYIDCSLVQHRLKGP